MSSIAPSASTDAVGERQGRVRLRFLDGLRGLAALYVLISHTVGQVQEGLIDTGRHVSVIFRVLRLPLEWGPDAVGVFIVLSGFCLMLPAVRSDDGGLPGGLREFARRRALRILPPYYAVCVIGIAWAIIDALKGGHALRDPGALLAQTGLSTGVLLSHLFVVYDFRPEWIGAIEAPLWSVAVEWHIYFIFALALLPIWRKAGIWACVALAVLVGSGAHFFLRSPYNLDWTHCYMLGLFAMGMAGAHLCFSDKPADSRWLNTVPWGRIFVSMVFVTYIVVAWVFHQRPNFFIMTPLVGLTATTLILWCVQSIRVDGGRTNAVVRLLESRAAVGLGAFSYSLYLVHGLVVVHVKAFLERHTLPLFLYYPATIVLCIGLSLAAAYLFYLAFERPFVRIKDRRN